MFLRRMEIKGFKSFSRPTTIEFTDGLTVVVGPNGSGKSNINDAFKWVLGETSKKNLRATSITDMIFSGSDSEKSADFAEVTLIFNNEKKVLDIDFNEVSITRRTFRQDKQSEYFINKTLVRRKDIKDLFLGTGLGNTDLSIISQGSVTKIAESKPKDLRELLNEAAGVSRYQSQKDEAVRKFERTEQSLEIFSVKLNELEKQVGPLKKKKEIAEKYLKIKEQLSEIELPIIKKDLFTNLKLKEELNNNIDSSSTKKELSERTLSKVEKKIRELQEKIISLDNELYSLQTKQNELNQQSLFIESNEKSLEEAIKKSIILIKYIKEIENNSIKKQLEFNNKLKDLRGEEFNLLSKKDQFYQNINKNEYEIQKFSKTFSSSLSRGTKEIIDNINIFDEIYGTVEELITFEKKYETAVLNSIGNRLSNLIVSNEETIKEALSFLKKNKLGMATFIPLLKVHPRNIPEEYFNVIKNLKGYIGTISSILKFESKFKNVAKSIGGHILIFEDIELGLKAAKLLNYKYEIVTIEGDRIFSGFVVKGGSNIKGGKISELKRILEELRKQHNVVRNNLQSKQEEIQLTRDKLSFSQTELIRSQDRSAYLESNLQKLLDQFKITTGLNYDLDSFKNSNEYISANLSLEQIHNRIKSIQLEKQKFQKEVINNRDEEHELRKTWEDSITVHTDSTIALNKIINVILRDIEILNKDYKMTYENLMDKKIIELKIPIQKAELLRKKLRIEILRLGFIDFDAINNYEDLFKSYEELKENVIDLKESKGKLLSTIEIMDKQMTKQFGETFEDVNKNFQIVFSTLFRGGKAQMVYTEPENILESGIEIEAKMLGKTVKSITLYSGGEKSLISLSLIFAINEVRKLPILMLDEVEASLDEVNVDRFAKFAKKLNETTQIVITSHRPGTMEQADILYGVTMQTKGITDIVSVKLADAVKLSE
ncbi:MAG: AAA family ATPase [Mycoplasmataceae bacterium]|nr:AAA family ATPase [Mycoplasmataceae bacterium]